MGEMMLKPSDMPIGQAQRVLKGNRYSYELKYDGFRVLWSGGLLKSEREITQNHKFPHIVEALKGTDVVLDGEICLNEKTTVFDINRKVNWKNAIYIIFDILEWNGQDLRPLPLCQRQEKLAEFLKVQKSKSLLSPRRYGSLEIGWEEVVGQQLEGLIVKDLNSIYTPLPLFKGVRTKSWFKVKNWKETELEVLDHEEGNVKGTFILEGGLRLSGTSVGFVSQFKTAKSLGKRVFAEISYLRETSDGKLFQPILKRLVPK